jgi:hypothetical protein
MRPRSDAGQNVEDIIDADGERLGNWHGYARPVADGGRRRVNRPGMVAKLVNAISATPFEVGRDPDRTDCRQDAAWARWPASGGATMAGKIEKPENPGPAPAAKAETFGEALDRMGCVALDPPRRIIVRRDRPRNRLTRWRNPKEQD